MIAALGTAASLAILWLAVVAIASTVEGSVGKLASALRGDRGVILQSRAVRVNARYPAPRAVRARARPEALRAAA